MVDHRGGGFRQQRFSLAHGHSCPGRQASVRSFPVNPLFVDGRAGQGRAGQTLVSRRGDEGRTDACVVLRGVCKDGFVSRGRSTDGATDDRVMNLERCLDRKSREKGDDDVFARVCLRPERRTLVPVSPPGVLEAIPARHGSAVKSREWRMKLCRDPAERPLPMSCVFTRIK